MTKRYKSRPGSANVYLDFETNAGSDLSTSVLLNADFAEIEKRVYSYPDNPWPRRSLLPDEITAMPRPKTKAQRVMDRIARKAGIDPDAPITSRPMPRIEFEQLKVDAGLFDVRQQMARFIRAMQEAAGVPEKQLRGSPSGRTVSPPEAMTSPYR